jgi:hypothetical protein
MDRHKNRSVRAPEAVYFRVSGATMSSLQVRERRKAQPTSAS